MANESGVDVLELRITIAARPETIFTFLSDPVAFEQWMGKGSTLGRGEGGNFRVMYPNGHVAGGVVEEVVPNERVVMSWGYEQGINDIPVGATRVEITLTPTTTGTEVTLRHTGLRSAEQRRNHRAGWRHYLGALSQLASGTLAAVVGQAIDRYFQAWAERDPAARMRLLEQCFTTQGVFRDAMGYVEGRDDLNEYIGMAQQFSPGITMQRDGAPSRSHEFVSQRWRMSGADGTPMMTGSNTIEFTGDGLIRSVTGFWNMP
jgi:uncharacterized protein YndB with AHSA1/START domain